MSIKQSLTHFLEKDLSDARVGFKNELNSMAANKLAEKKQAVASTWLIGEAVEEIDEDEEQVDEVAPLAVAAARTVGGMVAKKLVKKGTEKVSNYVDKKMQSEEDDQIDELSRKIFKGSRPATTSKQAMANSAVKEDEDLEEGKAPKLKTDKIRKMMDDSKAETKSAKGKKLSYNQKRRRAFGND